MKAESQMQVLLGQDDSAVGREASLADAPWMKLTEGNLAGALRATGATRSNVYLVPPKQLRVFTGFNVRVRNEDHVAHVRALADSMKAEGFFPDKPLSGLVVIEGGLHVIYIFDGHCRLEAVQLAIAEGAVIESVPVVISQQGVSAADMTAALISRNTGRPLEPIEKAAVIKMLLNMGFDTEAVMGRLGFTRQYFRDLMVLNEAPAEVKGMVERGELSAKTAVMVLRSEGEKAVEVLKASMDVAQAVGRRKVTEKVLQSSKTKKKGKGKTGAKALVVAQPVQVAAPAPVVAALPRGEQSVLVSGPGDEDLVGALTLVRKDAAFGGLEAQTRSLVQRLLLRVEQERFAAEAARAGVSLMTLEPVAAAVAVQEATAEAMPEKDGGGEVQAAAVGAAKPAPVVKTKARRVFKSQPDLLAPLEQMKVKPAAKKVVAKKPKPKAKAKA